MEVRLHVDKFWMTWDLQRANFSDGCPGQFGAVEDRSALIERCFAHKLSLLILKEFSPKRKRNSKWTRQWELGLATEIEFASYTRGDGRASAKHSWIASKSHTLRFTFLERFVNLLMPLYKLA